MVGRQVDAIDLPPDTTITTLVRDGEVIMAHHDTVIEADDHVILFLLDKRRVPDVEQLFQMVPEVHFTHGDVHRSLRRSQYLTDVRSGGGSPRRRPPPRPPPGSR